MTLLRWRLGPWHVESTSVRGRTLCHGTTYAEGTDGKPTDSTVLLPDERLTSLAVCGLCRQLAP